MPITGNHARHAQRGTVDAQAYTALALTNSAHAVLNGEVSVQLRVSSAALASDTKGRRRGQGADGARCRRTITPGVAARMARRSGTRTQLAGLRDLPRRHAGHHRAARAAVAGRPAGPSGIGARALETNGEKMLPAVAL